MSTEEIMSIVEFEEYCGELEEKVKELEEKLGKSERKNEDYVELISEIADALDINQNTNNFKWFPENTIVSAIEELRK